MNKAEQCKPMAAALSVGILWGVALFIMTLISSYTGYADHLLELLVGVYPFYDLSLMGAFVGLVLGFLDGAIGVYILIWLYNKLVNKLG